MKKVLGFSALGVLALASLSFSGVLAPLFSAPYLPHRFCYLAQPWLVWTNVITDGLIAASYVTIFAGLIWVALRLRQLPAMKSYLWVFISFGAFIFTCAATHIMEVVTVWWPVYPLSAVIKVLCAAVSIPTAILFTKEAAALAAGISGFVEALARSRQQNEDTVANYKEQIAAIDRSQMMAEFALDGSFLRANENYLRTFGYAAAELAGQNHSVFVTNEYRDSQVYKDFWEKLRDGEFQSGEFTRLGKDGQEVYIEASYNPIFSPEGHPVLVLKYASDVTDRVKLRGQFKDSQARLQAILDNVLEGIITFDGIGTIVSVNPAITKMFGYEPGEAVGKNVGMLMPDPFGGSHDSHLAPYKSPENTTVIGVGRELEGLTKSGHTFPLELTVTEVSPRGERLFVGLIRDITERKQAGALQSAIFNSANFSSIATDAKGVIQIFNVGAERMLGHVSADVMNKITPAEISDPQELIERAEALSVEFGTPISPGFEALVFKASRGIEDIYELTYIRKDGSRLPAIVSVTALRDTKDAIIGYLLIGTDNSARKQAEAQQRQIAQRLRDHQFYTRSLFEANIDALMTTDPTGIVTDVNRQMEALTGCTRDELIGAPFKQYFTDPDRAAAGISLVLKEKKVTDYQLTARDRSGHETVVSYNATTFYDRDRNLQGVFAAARDITERKQHEEALYEASHKAEEANRAKSDFLANMSHEIRTPMNAILGMTHLALRADPVPSQKQYLAKIDKAAQALLSIINDILDFSRIEAGKLQLEHIAFPLDEVLSDLDDLVGQKAAQKGISLAFVVAPEIPRYLMGDPLRLGQILINLVNNAIKFTHKGGVILNLELEDRGVETCRIRFSVQDTGIGMTPEQISSLFQAFGQADTSMTRRYGGTGLGLAITKRLCEMKGGTLAVTSALNKGSTFSSRLRSTSPPTRRRASLVCNAAI